VSEPEVDEARFAASQHVVKLTALRGTPMEGDRCATCHYYLEPSESLAFCWHEKLQILVGAEWWCHYWETRSDG
jgi:hypothetical protein